MKLWITHSLTAFGGHGLHGLQPISVPVVIGNVPFHDAGQPPPPSASSTQPSAAASPSQQPGHPSPHGPGGVTMQQPEVPPNAQLQSEAPPAYRAVVSGEKF